MRKRPTPIIFVAFADPRNKPGFELPGLADEEKRIHEALSNALDEEAWEYRSELNCTRDGLVDQFKTNRVAVFHFGGHSNPQSLWLPSEVEGNQLVSGLLLEEFQATQKSLKLAFFNACSNREWAAKLAEHIPYVIATVAPLDDDIALEFSSQFYSHLANKGTEESPDKECSVQEAFEGASRAVRLKFERRLGCGPQDGAGQVIASRRVDAGGSAAPAKPNIFPWILCKSNAAAAQAPWTLSIGANDPLVGIPPLYPRYYADLPDKPYVTIKGHEEKDAALFFGRNAEIRELYDWVLNSPDAPPIRLFYGQSGVGKSSLLNAGLLPRLKAKRKVVYLRRNRNLIEDLHSAIGGPSDEDAIAWLASSEPKLIILDQLEEAITHNDGSTTEIRDFIARVKTIFALRESGSKARLILSFRKEYLAEIRGAFAQGAAEDAPTLVDHFWLDRLDADGIVQVVTGAAISPLTRDIYQICFLDTESLPTDIAHDLMDRDSPISTILQIILNQLWDAAKPVEGIRTYTHALYKRLSALDNPLRGFFDAQIKGLDPMVGGIANDQGLELDLLFEHTTNLATSRRCKLADLKESYPQVPHIEQLITRNKELYLLAEPAKEPGGADGATAEEHTTALAHDTLAPIIRREFELSVTPGARARRLLENRARGWEGAKSGDTFDLPDLRVVRKGMPHMRALTDAENRLMDASKRSLRRKVALAASILLGIATIGGSLAWHELQQALSVRLAGEAKAAIATQYDLAVLLSAAALQAQATPEARDAIVSVFEARPDAISYLHLGQHADGSTAYSPDSKKLAVLAGETVELWDVPTRTRVWSAVVSGGQVTQAIEFSPDGTVLAIGGEGGASVQLWQTSNHAVIAQPLPHPPKNLHGMTFSADGKLLAGIGDCHQIQVWRLDTRQPLRDLSKTESACHTSDVDELAFDPADSQVLAVWLDDGTVSLENSGTGVPLSVIRTPGGNFDGHRGLAFSADGKRFAAITLSGGIDVYDFTAKRKIGTIANQDLRFFRFSPDGSKLAAATSDGSVGIWDTDTLFQVKALTDGAGPLTYTTAFSPDFRTAAVKAEDGDLLIIDNTRSWSPVPPAPAGPAIRIAYSPDGKWIATGTADGLICLWDAATDTPVWAYSGPKFDHEEGLPVSTLVFSTDSSILLFPREGRVVDPRIVLHRLNIKTKTLLPDLTDKPDGEMAIETAVFTPDGQIAAMSDSGVIRFWGDAAQTPVKVLRGRACCGNGFAISPDGELVAASGPNGDFDWSKLHGGDETIQKVGSNFWPQVVVFSPTAHGASRSLLAAGGSYGFSLWNTKNGQRISGGQEYVYRLAFSPDGSLLAVGIENGEIGLWDVDANRMIGQALQAKQPENLQSYPAGVAFAPDGRRIVAGTWNGSYRVWDWDLDFKNWPERACRIANRDLRSDEWNRYVGAYLPHRRVCKGSQENESDAPGK